MAALIEGHQYGLSAQDKINSNKSIVFVKLTDSALRSIEEYVKNKSAADTKPTIQFKNSNGVLSLPQNGHSQTFGFTLSNVEADGPQGSFECLRQNGHRSLESVGCMHMKMHIHANEDSYENTRVKMAAVEKEKNKSCTKVIKPAGAHLGRKVKVKRLGMVVNHVKPHSSPPSAPMIAKNHVKVTNGVSNVSSSSIPLKKLPEVNRFQKTTSENKFSPEHLNQPIRDRIIHILAVRPYKKLELITRLRKEGIREKDNKGIAKILTDVTLSKGNIYNLANKCWSEVQDNWKFGKPGESEIIRRRKHQFLNAKHFQSANITNESPPPPSSSPIQKRLASESFTVGQEPRGKKQRISHYSRTDNYNPSVKNESMDSNEKLHLTTTTMARKNGYSPSTNGMDQDVDSSPKSLSNSCDGFKPRGHYGRPDTLNQSVKKESSESAEKLHFTTSVTNRTTSSSPMASNRTSQNGVSSPKSPENSCDGYSSLPQRNSVSSHSEEISSSLNLRNASREDGEKNIRKHTTGLSQPGSRNPEKPLHKGQPPTKRYESDESSQKHSSLYSKSSVNSDIEKSSFHNQTLSHARLMDSLCEPEAQVSPDSPYETKELKSDSCSKNRVNGYVNSSIKTNGYSTNQSSYISRSKVTSTTNGSCSTSPHSPESCSDSNDSMGVNSPVLGHLSLPPSTPDSDPELPDYVSKYVRIISHEQRTRYKADFNAQYEEYKHLHSKIEKIKMKFMELDHLLRNLKKGSAEFMETSSKIMREYRATNQDENFKKSKEKLYYLHSKLSHIKKLVMDYDNFYVKS